MRKKNMSASTRTAIVASQTCEEHDGELFTNFCSAPSCIKPLCPECVETHYDFHREMGTKPQMESFRTVKQKCSRKLGQLLDAIHKEADNYEIYENSDFSKSFELSVRKVRQTKEMIDKIVKSYFSNLEDLMRKKMSHLMHDKSQLQQKLQLSVARINQIEALLKSLESNNQFIDNVQKVIKLDTQALFDRVIEQFQSIKSIRGSFQISVNIQKTIGQNLQILLSKSILIGNSQAQMNTVSPYIRQPTRRNTDYGDNQSRHSGRSGRSRSKRKTLAEDDKFNKSKRDYYNTVKEPSENGQETSSRKLKVEDSRVSKSKVRTISIIGLNTFKEESKRKYLHFFQNDDNFLHMMDLNAPGSEFTAIKLDIGFKVPSFHKSISTPNGDLYLIGGSIPNSSVKSQKIYKYDFDSKTLNYCTSLKYGRSSHSLCFNNKYIYIVGGFLNNQVVTNKCERYDIVANKVEEIQNCFHPVNSFSLASFNGRYIFKFGGVGEKQDILHYIERFDQKTAKWKVIDPVFQGPTNDFMLLSTTAAVQITPSEIMVMGGYDENNNGYKQTYILAVDGEVFTIKDVNSYPLPSGQAFWNNNPIIHNKMMLCLQNIPTNNKEDCIENHRRILAFDGQAWKSLN